MAATGAVTSTAATAISPSLLSATLRRAPFCIFSKRAPATLPHYYNVDKDFTYYFYSDFMKQVSGLSPSFLTTTTTRNDGPRNAKTDFPVGYEKHFQDDVDVCTKYLFPKVKIITEPWTSPALTTVVETRKTCIRITSNDDRNNNQEQEGSTTTTTTTTETDDKSELYMLGCFCPHDDVELGVTSFKATFLPPRLDPLPHVPSHWYAQAFEQLPMAVRILSLDADFYPTILAANQLAHQDFAVHGTNSALDRIRGLLPKVMTTTHDTSSSSSSKSSEDDYQVFHVGGMHYRLWIWRVQDDNNNESSSNSSSSHQPDTIFAVAYRRKHQFLPTLVEDSFTSRLRTLEEMEDDDTMNFHLRKDDY
ncbi:hypothetical protein ACA910_015722 [Epithemia clementina (nom. ined.)]